MTGIDRVEYAYLSFLLKLDAPFFGLVRTAAGWLLLDRSGCKSLYDLAQAMAQLAPADFLSRLSNRKDPMRARAESAARRICVARTARPFLGRLLRCLPGGASYLNVGHANLTARGLAALRRSGLRISIMIHDTIPLDHPEFARPGTVEPFRAKLKAVSAHADQIIHITNTTRARTEAHLKEMGRIPQGITARIGVGLPLPDNSALPLGLDLARPYFVTLGTIEPRKNHALLLDVWEKLGPDAPTLFIVGGRGWADNALLERLDALLPTGPVQVLSGLSDGAVSALLAGARALLAPSLAEGFGLPPLEAASLGIRVIATDLCVTRELLGDKAVYLSPSDSYSWMETINEHIEATKPTGTMAEPLQPPDWAAHFKTVLSLL
jgi:glycosyltransferase involved in cell wall biosynthesis